MIISWIEDPTGRFRKHPYFLQEGMDRHCEQIVARHNCKLYDNPSWVCVPIPCSGSSMTAPTVLDSSSHYLCERRHVAGAVPTAFLNARENAASDS
jgi:hypothetical protein